jgi:hypothetical protein
VIIVHAEVVCAEICHLERERALRLELKVIETLSVWENNTASQTYEGHASCFL